MTYAVDLPFTANADLSSLQYRVIAAGSVAGECAAQTTDMGSSLGILQNDPVQGEEATVRVYGRSWAYVNTEASGSAVTVGGLITAASDSMVRGYIAGAACKHYLGFALEAVASGSGILAEVFVQGPIRTM
jgi:hypothetical protein